jgi:hypothetical protein
LSGQTPEWVKIEQRIFFHMSGAAAESPSLPLTQLQIPSQKPGYFHRETEYYFCFYTG